MTLPRTAALELEDCQRSVSLPDQAVDRPAQHATGPLIPSDGFRVVTIDGQHDRKRHFVEAFAPFEQSGDVRLADDRTPDGDSAALNRVQVSHARSIRRR